MLMSGQSGLSEAFKIARGGSMADLDEGESKLLALSYGRVNAMRRFQIRSSLFGTRGCHAHCLQGIS